MSLVANETDEISSLRIVNNTAVVHTTLKNRFLKKMEKYSAAVRTFYTNAVPPLFHEDFVLLKIYPKDDLDALVTQWVNPPHAHYIEPEQHHELQIKRDETHNILDFVQQISDFLKKVNKNIFIYGSSWGANVNHHIGPGIVDPTQIHDNVDTGEPFISFSIDSGGHAIFDLNQEFLDQWYIEFDPHFATLIGIERYLWSGTTTQNIRVSEGSVFEHVPGVPLTATLFREPNPGVLNFNYTIDSITVGGRGLVFSSKKSLFLADQRQTLVVEMSLPFSRTIHSENGKYLEKYRLCEFPIDNYIDSRGSLECLNGQTLAKVRTTDTLTGGLSDFTKGFQETHIIHFLPGDLYTINTRIYIVYKSFTGVHVEKDYELNGGFYDFEVLFVKKQTLKNVKQRQ